MEEFQDMIERNKSKWIRQVKQEKEKRARTVSLLHYKDHRLNCKMSGVIRVVDIYCFSSLLFILSDATLYYEYEK
jgi:hypothetical protein